MVVKKYNNTNNTKKKLSLHFLIKQVDVNYIFQGIFLAFQIMMCPIKKKNTDWSEHRYILDGKVGAQSRRKK